MDNTMIDSLVPVNNLSFQVAWESTLKCNMDCSYCGDGHNNRLQHPSLEDSLKTVDFIFEYLQIQMNNKPSHMRIAGLNVQGGESVFHPNIIEILEYIQSKKEKIDYTLTVALITNAVVGQHQWDKVCKLVDHFTVSFHAEGNSTQEGLFKDNVRGLIIRKKSFQVNVMMHPKKELWLKCLKIIRWLKAIKAPYHVRQIDHHWFDIRFNYSPRQVKFLTGKTPTKLTQKIKAVLTRGHDLASTGRACCGGNSMCVNNSYDTKYVEGNNFQGWSCSVDKYFLYIRQTTGEVFTNKDCRMTWDDRIGPIGNLKDTRAIIDRLLLGTPTIVCKKTKCWCGLCAPKAATPEKFKIINHKYATEEVPQLKDQ
jgi:MoaA/NifB/PqqE/SkfB family radical SAM enzyme